MKASNDLQPAESLVGKLLVASTIVQDPMLNRSVSLVVHQDPENVFAVLLNRPMAAPAGLAKMMDASANQSSANQSTRKIEGHPTGQQDGLEFDDDVDGTQDRPKESSGLAEQAANQISESLGKIHFGGPLSGPVVAVHCSSEHAEAQAGEGVYVAAERSLLETLVKQKPCPYRLIVGHLGWTGEQLQAERDAGYWHLLDATGDDVFTVDEAIWPKVIRRATTTSMARWLGISEVPPSVELN